MAHQVVVGADGTRIAVRAAGPPDAPVLLLVHGWAQSARCWHRQLDDTALTSEFRVVAMDLRGHGCSGAPPHGYHDLGADLHAVLAAFTGRPAVLVGWSYGGLVIADYLASHGPGATAGVLLTGAITGIGRGVAAGRIGPAMRAALPDALSEDPTVAVPALSAFVAAMPAAPLGGAEEQALLGAALATPPRVRAALFDRRAGGGHFGHVPVLVQHGTGDRVVDPSTAEHHLATVAGARADWWHGGGHLPFAEDAPRFGRTLLGFARQCTADRERMAR